MNEQIIDEKLNEINSITDMDASNPSIPVSIILQEAQNLEEWCKKDKDALVRAGLDWKLVEDLPVRAGALRVIQGKWASEYKSYQDCQAEWKEKSPQAFNMRDEMVHFFYHALYNIPNEYSKVQRIAEGSSNADMIQDLIDLSELGKKHSAKLEAIGMDISLLDKARTLSFELAELLARVNGAQTETSPKLETRNKAYTLLKEAIDEIRRVGQFVFWRNKQRMVGYTSVYVRRTHKKSEEKVAVQTA